MPRLAVRRRAGARHDAASASGALAAVDPRLNGYTQQQARAFYARLLDATVTLPGVESASLADCEPLGNHTFRNVFLEGRVLEEPLAAPITLIAPGYFATLRIPLLVGRDFTARDGDAAPKVAIINETFAKSHFPGENPIGRRLGFGNKKLDVEIVGW